MIHNSHYFRVFLLRQAKQVFQCAYSTEGFKLRFSLVGLSLILLCGCASPINSVGLTANPDGTFGVNVGITGGKHLVWHNVPAESVRALQVRYPSVRLLTRDIDPCSATRALDGASANLTGDAREVARAINRAIHEDREVSRESLKDLNRLHRMTSPSMKANIARFFRGENGCCAEPISPVTSPPIVEVVTNPPVNLPDIGDTGLPPSGIIPPPAADKAVTNALVKRVEILETRVNGIDTKLDLIIAKLDKK